MIKWGIVLAFGICLALGTLTYGQLEPCEDPLQLAEHFWRQEVQGKRLTASGHGEISDLFVRTASYRKNRSVFVISNDSPVKIMKRHGERLDYVAEYWRLGQIDSKLRFKPAPTTSGGVRIGAWLTRFRLIRVTKAEYGTAREKCCWRIEEEPEEISLEVRSAIKYVNEALRQSNDSAIRQNAAKTLATLAKIESKSKTGDPDK